MIKDMISNIIQKAAGNSSENIHSLAKNGQLKSEFNALLSSLKKESAGVDSAFPKHEHGNSDQSNTSNNEHIDSKFPEETVTDTSLINAGESIQVLPVKTDAKNHRVEQKAELIQQEAPKIIGQVTVQDIDEEVGIVIKEGTANQSQTRESRDEGERSIKQSPELLKGRQTAQKPLVNTELVDRGIFSQEKPSFGEIKPASKVHSLQFDENSTRKIQHREDANTVINNEIAETENQVQALLDGKDEKKVSSQKSEPITASVSDEVIALKMRNDFVDSPSNYLAEGTTSFQKILSEKPIQAIKSANETTREQTEVLTQPKSKFNTTASQAEPLENLITDRAFGKANLVQQTVNMNQGTPSHQPQVASIPLDFSEGKNPELIQFIQTNKSGVIKPKEAKEQRFALSMTEQAETRLKLLVDSVRPELLSTREAPVGFITSHTLDNKIQFFNPTLTLSSDQEAFLKEFMTESIQGKDQKTVDNNSLGYMRLGELPIANTTARRALVSSFTKVMQQEMSSSASRNQENWQKHSFKIGDGNNIDLTTKNVDGVLHIKLAASNPELNRLLMSMEQEIKDHLKGELNLELDLQFTNQDQETFSGSLDDSSAENRKKWQRHNADLAEENAQEAVKSLQPSIRNFGYNQMEWTA